MNCSTIEGVKVMGNQMENNLLHCPKVENLTNEDVFKNIRRSYSSSMGSFLSANLR